MAYLKELFSRGGRLAVCGLLMTAAVFAQNSKPTIIYPSHFAVSQPLGELPIAEPRQDEVKAPQPNAVPVQSYQGMGVVGNDSALQTEVFPDVPATKLIDFDGTPSSVSSIAVGPNHIVQNDRFYISVYNKSGVLLSGPTGVNTLLAGCSPVLSYLSVNYDRLANRWVISAHGNEFLIPFPYRECVAVSTTPDPLGAYNVYGFNTFDENFDPRLSVWPTASNSAYLFSSAGSLLCGLDRAKMLAGDPTAAMLCNLQSPIREGRYLPLDLDGSTPPSNGTPGLFLSLLNNNPGQLSLRKLSLNFAAGTVSLSTPFIISVANFTRACPACIPQKGTTQTLFSSPDDLKFRVPYRKFADHERVVLTHAVDNNGQVVLRWYELLDLSSAPKVNQQGTYAPDTTYRWVGSIAMDKANNIAMGYSVSSAAINPGIRFTGRLAGDPLDTMRAENSILEGTGSQTSSNFWSDFANLQLDPIDDCTFWYSNQYLKSDGTDLSTRIAAFKFDGCDGGVGTPAVSLSPSSLNFATVAVGQTSALQTVTLRNTGSAPLSISNVAASGDYQILNNTCGASVAAGANCGVSVTFRPTVSGTRTGNLTFTDNAFNSQQSVALSGVGGGGTPAVSLSPTALNFGPVVVVVGETSAPQTVTLRNTGTAPLNISNITVSGDYQISSNSCGASVADGANCSVSVTFRPTVSGTCTGNLTFTDNAPNSPQSLALTGVGGTPAVSLSPSTLKFGTVGVGQTSAPQTVTLTNTGTATLTISNIYIVDGDYLVFGGTCGISVAAGASCNVSVAFQPTAPGTRTGNLLFNDNTPNSPQYFPLTGVGGGGQPVVSLSPTSLNFATVVVGQTSTPQTVTLSNTGTAPLNISNIAAGGDYQISSNTCGASVAAGANCNVSVTFRPTVSGTRTGTLTFTDNALNNPQSVALTGVGQVVQALRVSPTALDFGSIQVGRFSVQRNVTVSNAGSTAVTLNGFMLSGTNPGDYQVISSTCGASIAPGANCSVGLRFRPNRTGTRRATLNVRNNGAGNPATVNLTGFGF